jgi:hypothetical protein
MTVAAPLLFPLKSVRRTPNPIVKTSNYPLHWILHPSEHLILAGSSSIHVRKLKVSHSKFSSLDLSMSLFLGGML